MKWGGEYQIGKSRKSAYLRKEAEIAQELEAFGQTDVRCWHDFSEAEREELARKLQRWMTPEARERRRYDFAVTAYDRSGLGCDLP